MTLPLGKTPPLIVVSAPSGTGKTSLTNRLIALRPQFLESISLTTRPQRMGEINGTHYHFVSADQFAKFELAGRMLETAEVHGFRYGSSLDELERIRAAGKQPVLVIDVQGWISIRKKIPDAVSIMLLPPSIASLWDRMQRRGTDNHETRIRRLRGARHELTLAKEYQFFVINDQFDAAYSEFERIAITGVAKQLDHAAGVRHAERLVAEFDRSRWAVPA
jgi:guanylate kinase